MSTITDSHEGNTVVDANGETVGIVTSVRHGTAYVDPDPGITERVSAKLGWRDVDEEDFPLQEAEVAAVTDDEIRLRRL